MRHNSEANHHIIIASPRRARKRNGATHLARVYVSGSHVAGGAGALNSKGLQGTFVASVTPAEPARCTTCTWHAAQQQTR